MDHDFELMPLPEKRIRQILSAQTKKSGARFKRKRFILIVKYAGIEPHLDAALRMRQKKLSNSEQSEWHERECEEDISLYQGEQKRSGQPQDSQRQNSC